MNTQYIVPPDRSEIRWRKGPPPEIGWWPASLVHDPQGLRYWDGEKWSRFVPMDATQKMIEVLEKTGFFDFQAKHQANIVWCKRWWLTPHNKGGKA